VKAKSPFHPVKQWGNRRHETFFIPQPVWAAAFGLAQMPCVAGLAVFHHRNFQPLGGYMRADTPLPMIDRLLRPFFDGVCGNSGE